MLILQFNELTVFLAAEPFVDVFTLANFCSVKAMERDISLAKHFQTARK